MSQHQFFKRMPVNQQVAQKLETITFPAPTRGLTLAENESFMQPGSAIVMDNWKPTMKGCSLRGGCIRWAELPETTPVISAFEYASGATHKMFAANATKVYDVTTTTPARGHKRTNIRQLRCLAARQPGRRLDAGSQRRRRPVAAV